MQVTVQYNPVNENLEIEDEVLEKTFRTEKACEKWVETHGYEIIVLQYLWGPNREIGILRG